MTATQREDLDTAGYVVLTNFLDQHALDKVRDRVEELYQLEGENAGSCFASRARRAEPVCG